MAFKYLNPKLIRFTQDTIGKRFRNGTHVNTLIRQIRDNCRNEVLEIMDKQGIYVPKFYIGNKLISRISNIQVYEEDGKYFSIDNRRLYLFKALAHRNCVTEVLVEIVDKSKMRHNYSAVFDGKRLLFVRFDKTFSHN